MENLFLFFTELPALRARTLTSANSFTELPALRAWQPCHNKEFYITAVLRA
jgi:hypothetical protein